uniref:Ubiquinone biosynthesis protein COQ4 homolog, mitochondrial n=2 Tax=Hirondellea gigas TaxID=1518452 RepID=A0A6A7G1F6_9CRUS
MHYTWGIFKHLKNSTWITKMNSIMNVTCYTTTARHNSTTAAENIPINGFQRSLLSVGAAAAALLNPGRHDMVATLGETTGQRALIRIHKQMQADSEGQQILKDRPRINSSTVNLNLLRLMPEGTLGWCYTKFLDDNKVTPDSRRTVQFVSDSELCYVMQRYREVHDLFHSVLGMPTNMLGEVAVKWVEALQTGLPMCAGAALFGPLRFKTKQRDKYVRHYLPWAIKIGSEAKPLMNIYYEKRWDQQVEDLRQEMNITPFSIDNI